MRLAQSSTAPNAAMTRSEYRYVRGGVTGAGAFRPPSAASLALAPAQHVQTLLQGGERGRRSRAVQAVHLVRVRAEVVKLLLARRRVLDVGVAVGTQADVLR